MKRILRAAFAVISLSAGMAGLWVGAGVTPALAQNDLVQGGLRLPYSHRYEVYEPSSGKYTQVDIMTVPDRVAKGAPVYDRTAKAWVNHPSVGGRNPSYAASGAAASSNDAARGGGLVLPRDHRYEVYEPSSGKYTQVDIMTVPDRVAQGAPVYDRTAGAWVNHPSVGGRNPRYTATGAATSSNDAARRGGLALPRDHRYEVYNPSSGQYTVVDVNSVPDRVQQGQHVYDRTAKAWVARGNTNVNPDYTASGSASASGRGDRRDERWDRVRGTVERFNGQQIVVRADDGRLVTADLSQTRRNELSGLKHGDRVTIGGVMEGNVLMARFVRGEGEAGAAADTQPQGDWQRIHGAVQNVQGSTLRFRADDGRVLTVDMSKVNPEVQRALTRGERATVVGFAGARANEFRAEYIQQDSSDPSRGGAIAPSASPR